MSRATSFFLDVLRVVAALTVFFYHCVLFWYPGQANGIIGHLGHRAVIVFFVLSGYVIAYATWRRESNLRAYAIARLSRLYSVVLPALFLTLGMTLLGRHLHPGFYAALHRDHEVLRYVLTAFFCQSIWTLNAAPPTNGPFWSLGYEFWYYALFAVAIFIRGKIRRALVMAVLLLISGVDSLLLMPAWIMGVLLYLHGRKQRMSGGAALIGFLVAFAAFLAALLGLPDCPWHYGYPPFFFSSAFLTDNGIGLLLAAVIWFADQSARDVVIAERLDGMVRWTADHTFSLYLYHFPLVLLVAAVVPFDRQSGVQVSALVVAILAAVTLLSLTTESLRPAWRKFFATCWDFVFARQTAQ